MPVVRRTVTAATPPRAVWEAAGVGLVLRVIAAGEIHDVGFAVTVLPGDRFDAAPVGDEPGHVQPGRPTHRIQNVRTGEGPYHIAPGA